MIIKGSTVKFGLVACLMIFGMPDLAHADTFEVSVLSGQKKRVHVYISWQNDCTPDTGIVKALVKPQHGTLTPSEVDNVVRKNRFNANDPCNGTLTTGFQVEYQSEPGFQGSDSFKIEVTYPNRSRVIDIYNVSVK